MNESCCIWEKATMNMLEWKQQMYNVHMQRHILSWYAFLNPHGSDMKCSSLCSQQRAAPALHCHCSTSQILSAPNSTDCYTSELSYTLTHYIVLEGTNERQAEMKGSCERTLEMQ